MGTLKFPLPKEDRQIIEKAIIKHTIKTGFDFLWNDYFQYRTHFESLDNFTATSVHTTNAGNVGLQDGGVIISNNVSPTGGDSMSLSKSRPTDSRFDFVSDSRFRCTAAFVTNANQEISIVCGVLSAHAYGFMLDDGALSGLAQTGSGSRSKVTILSPIAVDTFYVLDARFFPEIGKVEYYIDGVLKGTITTNLPTTNNTFLWVGKVLTDNTTQKAMQMWDVEVMQKRFK